MRKTARQRWTALLCALVAFSLAFVPVAHASVLMSEGSLAPDSETVHRCDQNPGGLAEVTVDSHHLHFGGAADTDCEHGASCQIACSILVLHLGSIETGDYDSSNRWLSPDSSGLYSSFPSRLERPPRT